jgi:hypothetical protein
MTVLSDTKQRLLNRYKSGAAAAAAPQGITRRPSGNIVPQSATQEQIFIHVQMIGDTSPYNELVTIHRHGALDVQVLERVLDEMNRRHEAWRTTFDMGDDEPIQIIHPSAAPVKLRFFDVRSRPLKDRAAESKRLGSENARGPFNLKELPLWRAVLVRLEDEEYQLHMNLHHMVMDGVSLYGILLPEVIALYDAFAAGKPSPLPDPDLQYADFAVWQRRTLTREAMAADLAFWKKTLANPAPPLAWPVKKPRPEIQTYRGATELLVLPAEVIDPLRALAVNQSATLFMALATGFFIILHRYTGQTDITLGSPTASRPADAGHVMGNFQNTMPVRVDLSGNPTYSEALLRVRASVLDALQHCSVPMLDLVRQIRPAYDLSRNPLFQIMMSLEPPMEAVDPAWDLTQATATSGRAKMDMYLNMDARPHTVMAPIIYNPDLFDPADVRSMFADWRAILEGAIARPETRIAELPLAPPVEAPKATLQGRIRRWFGR